MSYSYTPPPSEPPSRPNRLIVWGVAFGLLAALGLGVFLVTRRPAPLASAARPASPVLTAPTAAPAPGPLTPPQSAPATPQDAPPQTAMTPEQQEVEAFLRVLGQWDRERWRIENDDILTLDDSGVERMARDPAQREAMLQQIPGLTQRWRQNQSAFAQLQLTLRGQTPPRDCAALAALYSDYLTNLRQTTAETVDSLEEILNRNPNRTDEEVAAWRENFRQRMERIIQENKRLRGEINRELAQIRDAYRIIPEDVFFTVRAAHGERAP